MEKNEVLPKGSRQLFAPTPQLVKSDEIDIGNKSIDENERDQTNDVGRYMYRWDLMEIGSGRVDFTGRQKSERKQDEVEEDGTETRFVDVIPEDAGEYQCER